MEGDVNENKRVLLNDSDERLRSAVNSTVLDYYKKFGRKRDLEQYFSLSTAQSEIRDPTSLFWRRMKEQSDTSDSGEKKSESSNEVCRISIRCSIPETYKPQRFDSPVKSDSESPPIITDGLPGPSHTGEDSADDNHSQKSMDGTLDTSMNKPLSPTSSITSQRKLEWDSLADVGYGNESDRKTSASSLSTLEREVLAQKQQYTLDIKQNSNLGLPTAHSTPVDPNDSKHKSKKGQGKKTMTFSKKDVDVVEVCMPESNTPAINVNLTKQFSVNLDKDGGITVDNVKKDVTVSPEKASVSKEASPQGIDKVVQTSLLRPKEKSQSSIDHPEKASPSVQKVPVLICLNTLRRKHRRKKMRTRRTKIKSTKKTKSFKETMQDKDKSGEQVSEAESFEYMPGHMYNQNQVDENQNRHNNAGNKSSLESSAVQTTDSSKESQYSFTKDLEKSLDVLKSALKDKYDPDLKKKLVKEIIQRLLRSKYKDDDSTPDFLSVLSLTSKKTPTTSTSEADNTGERVLHTKPKKSILRVNKFNSNDIASTSQSAPNLPSVVNSEKPVIPYLPKLVSSTTTDTDVSAANSSAKDASSDTLFAKTSSEELYKKYIDALKKEEAYKQHLKEKELFLRQKLVRSDTALKVPSQLDLKINNRLKELLKDLTRNNYDDGSGDASKLEGGSTSNYDIGHRIMRKQRSHSVFTLSSGNSDFQNKKCARSKDKKEIATSPRPGPSNCRQIVNRPTTTDSSVQVSIKFTDDPDEIKHVGVQKGNSKACGSPSLPEEVKYVCLCSEKALTSKHNHDEFLIYKCSRLTGENPVQMLSKASNTTINRYICTSPRKRNKMQANSPREDKSAVQDCCLNNFENKPSSSKVSKSSQTNIKLAADMQQPSSAQSAGSSSSSSGKRKIGDGYSRRQMDSPRNNCTGSCSRKPGNENIKMIQESTRCLQTEISIHPKISDPSVSDINIIKSADCVALISELYRKVSQSSSENACLCSNDKYDVKTNTSGRSSKDNISVEDRCEDNFTPENDNLRNQPIVEEVPLQTSVGGYQESLKQSENIPDNKIVIPIQGTNMTLKVSIGGGSLKSQEKQDLMNTAVTTDKVENDEKFTSITADCSKAVQSKTVPDFKQTVVLASNCDYNFDENNSNLKNNDNQLCTKTTYPASTSKCNTYPKVVQINENKPLLRSYTDTGNLGACSAIQTDKVDKSDKEIQPYHPMTNQQEISPTLDMITDYKHSQKFKETLTSNSTSHSTSEQSRSGSERKSDKNPLPRGERQKSKAMCSNLITDEGTPKDLILDMIQDITKRYSKTNVEKSSRKKCFKEIITVLNYLLDTDDSGDSVTGEQEDGQSSKKIKSSNKQNNDSEIVCYREAKDSTSLNEDKALEIKKLSPHKRNKSHSREKPIKTAQKNSGKCVIRSRNASPGSETLTRAPVCIKNVSSHGDSTIKSPVDISADASSSSSVSKSERKISSSKPTPSVKVCGCGCGESECNRECENPKADKEDEQSLLSKKRESKQESPKTSDKACGCGCNDFECNDFECNENDHECGKKTGEKSGKQCLLYKKQERNDDSPKTCDKACECGCDDFDCKDNSDNQYGNDKAVTTDSRCLTSKKQESRKELPSTCDKACECGCDSSECKESSQHECSKSRSDKQFLKSKKHERNGNSPKKLVSKCVQSTARRVKSMYCRTDSSDVPVSTDQPTASDSPTARIINKIKKECEKYQKRCKSHCDHNFETSSSTSMNCNRCNRTHQCSCKAHKCRNHRTKTTMEKIQKKCVAYNLILQTSDSLISEENCFDDRRRPLPNIVVKVPKRRQENIPFKEMAAKIEQKLTSCSPRCCSKNSRSRSWPNEGISSTDDVKMAQANTVRDYLEKNRPDFVERCASRQNCIRLISDSSHEAASASPRWKMVVIHNQNPCMNCTGQPIMCCEGVPMNYNCPDPCVQTVENEVTRIASERSRQREVLSMQLGSLPTLTKDEMRYLAKKLGLGRSHPNQPKIISEREMKKHSEKIYKSLPEVVQKKEDARKESMKRTNLLMASIFKKNLQKKTLRGAVNLSNYSAVIKI